MASSNSSSAAAVVVVGWPALSFCLAVNVATFAVGLACNALAAATIVRTRALIASSINRAVLSLCLADLICVLAELPLATAVVAANFAGDMVCTRKKRWSLTLSPLTTRPLLASVQPSAVQGPDVQLHPVPLDSDHGLPRHRHRALLLHSEAFRERGPRKEGQHPHW